MNNHSLNENLEYGDLARLINRQIHIDQYKSKMGDDADICVISFVVRNKEPAVDLMSFIEKGYDWVLDADVSSGEKSNGEYLVFIEVSRSQDLPQQLENIIDDITNLVEFDKQDWTFRYYKLPKSYPVDKKIIADLVPLTPDDYRRRFDSRDIDEVKSAAGLPVQRQAPRNQYTESLRAAAGIK